MKPGQRRTIEVQDGFIFQTCGSANGRSVKIFEKFIPKKQATEIQPLEGWLISKIRRHRRNAHYFVKGDMFSLCGGIRLTEINSIIPCDFRPKCQHCERVINTYQDLKNRRGHNEGVRGYCEW